MNILAQYRSAPFPFLPFKIFMIPPNAQSGCKLTPPLFLLCVIYRISPPQCFVDRDRSGGNYLWYGTKIFIMACFPSLCVYLCVCGYTLNFDVTFISIIALLRPAYRLYMENFNAPPTFLLCARKVSFLILRNSQ